MIKYFLQYGYKQYKGTWESHVNIISISEAKDEFYSKVELLREKLNMDPIIHEEEAIASFRIGGNEYGYVFIEPIEVTHEEV